MKIGRNDPCACGSGLKYKKCCMNKANSDVNITGDQQPIANDWQFVDFNEVVKEVAKNESDVPEKKLLGLSPFQVKKMGAVFLENLTDFIKLNPACLSIDDVVNTKVYWQTKFLMEKIYKSGFIRMEPQDAEYQKLLNDFGEVYRSKYDGDKLDSSLIQSDFHKNITLLTKFGAITRQGPVMAVEPKEFKVLVNDPVDWYNEMFDFFTQGLNWSIYLYSDEKYSLFQDNLVFALYMLKKMAANPVSGALLCDTFKKAFPSVSDLNSGAVSGEKYFESAFLYNVACYFGFVRIVRDNGRMKHAVWQTTPLFERFFIWCKD